MRAVYIGLLSVLIGAPPVLAGAVDQSLRPQMRPGSGLITAAVVVSSDVPVRSLRPQLRPADVSETAIVPVNANPRFDTWVAGFRGRAHRK